MLSVLSEMDVFNFTISIFILWKFLYMTYFYYLTLLPPVELIILGLTARTIKTNEKETRKLSILVLVVFL